MIAIYVRGTAGVGYAVEAVLECVVCKTVIILIHEPQLSYHTDLHGLEVEDCAVG